MFDLIPENKSPYTIYCDMDGVLTDFSGDFMKYAKLNAKVDLDERDDVPNNAAARYEKKHGSDAFWKVVESGGLKFWSDMSWNPGGKKLWKVMEGPTTNSEDRSMRMRRRVWIAHRRMCDTDADVIL